MNIMIAVKKGDTVYLGTDTRVIINDEKTNELCECNHSIQKAESGMLVGLAVELPLKRMICANLEMFTLDKKGKLTRKHIVKNVIPSLIQLLKRENLLVEKDEELPYMKGVIFLANDGDLYLICADFTVVRIEKYQVLGENSDYAVATIINYESYADVNDCIVKALKIADKYCVGVGAPYLLIDTKTKQYKLIGE